MDNGFKMVGLETLVRGYTFNINSGAIESLELDSFGISITPSSLVSTYALLVEDVLEVVSDIVVVHEAAASHIQRGFGCSKNEFTRWTILMITPILKNDLNTEKEGEKSLVQVVKNPVNDHLMTPKKIGIFQWIIFKELSWSESYTLQSCVVEPGDASIYYLTGVST